jgi:hypothetical protein
MSRALRLLARTRKALLVVVAVLVLVVAGLVVGGACPVGGCPMTLGADDVMSPDGIMNLGPGHTPLNYAATKRGTDYTVKRNGVAWLTISNVNGVVQIKDPNGAATVVIIKAPAKAR